MLLRGIDSILSNRSQEIGKRWLVQTRKAPNLTGLAIISDADLMEFSSQLLAILGGWFRAEAGKPEIGAFFVGAGKDFCKKDVPISLLTRAFVNLRKLVTECLLEEENLEGTHVSMLSWKLLTTTQIFSCWESTISPKATWKRPL